MSATASAASPADTVLRTLAPALRGLEHDLRTWLERSHRHPLTNATRATLESLTADLKRSADALDVDKPLLMIVLMGGTGVGKSTLLNALAGGTIADASVVRPTTRDPVVYYHDSIRSERLDLALHQCRLVPHDRIALEQKVIVDTPDLDSNDLANREKLAQLLPVADIVLYAGSQEKYHDRLGWELFLQQRRRHAFAFVLNKWDRCMYPSSSGVRPDLDLLRDLKKEGFAEPLLFRTCAQYWVDRAQGDGSAQLPEGEQFLDLVHWIETDLSRVEIEAIKARGVTQLLQQLDETLLSATPPDLGEAAERSRGLWERALAEEAQADAEVLLDTLDPYQREVEHHFALQGQRRFRGIMAGYLRAFTKVRYLGSQLRDYLPLAPHPREENRQLTWDLAAFTSTCSDAAASRSLDARTRALGNRLLLTAAQQGFPIELLQETVDATARLDWRQRYSRLLSGVLQQVETEWTRPKGWRRGVQGVVVFLADWLPVLAFLAACAFLVWHYFQTPADFRLESVLIPFAVMLIVLVFMHILVSLLLPLRWPAIRNEFRRRLEACLREELQKAFAPLPQDVAGVMQAERQEVDALRKQTGDLSGWLREREQAASIAGLYGK